MRLLPLFALVILVGCSGKDDTSGADDTAAMTDTTPVTDDTGGAGDDTASAADDTGGGSDDTSASGDDTASAGETGAVHTGDTGGVTEPLEGFGELSGDCWALDEAQLTGDDPWFVTNTLDFGELDFDYDALSEGGQEIYDEGNLGGSSEYSEIFSYEVLYRCELAALLLSESEIAYVDANGKKTDLLVSIDGINIAVSVTRAYKYPPEKPYTENDALILLLDKLGDVPLSTANQNAKKNSWDKQILHVIAYTPEHSAAIEAAYLKLDDETRGDTILVVTATEGNDEHLY